MVDSTAVANVTGVSTSFVNLRGGKVLRLPQRIAVFAQGRSDVVYDSSTKYPVPSPGAVAARFGFGSPAHLIVRELMPPNGDGVGTIPVTIYPLQDDPSGVVASGDITPSGTATVSQAYNIRISGVMSLPFVIPAGVVNVSDTLARMGDALAGVLEMPMKFTYTYGAVTASAITGTGNGTVTALSVTGAPRPGAWTLKNVSAVVNGGVWSLTDSAGNVISAALTQTVGAGAATVFNVGGIQFTVTDGTTDFGLGASFTITVPATKINLTSVWKGASANRLLIELMSTSSVGVVFAITQPAGGLVNPDITAALGLMGNVWETMCINAMEIADTTTLDRFQTFGEGRWGDITRKPLVVFTGTAHTTVALATAVSSVRRADRVDSQLVAPGSVNLPCVIAARQVARIAKMANESAPTGYAALPADRIIPGADGIQWDYPTRDQAVKAGSSTVEVTDGVVMIGDVVTFYRPSGEDPPAYRNVVNIVKLQNVIFNISLLFAGQDWAAAPLIPDGQATNEPRAKTPSMAKALVASMIDSLGLAAIISDPATAKKTIVSAIDSQNPDRLNIEVTVQLSGNTTIKAATLRFGFFFGTAALAA